MTFRPSTSVWLSIAGAVGLAAAAPAHAQFVASSRKPQADTSALAAARTSPMQLKATTTDGRVIDLAKLRGKVVVLEFWSLTNCYGGCQQEEQNLKAVYDKYRARGVEIVRLAFESDAKNRPLVEQAAKENGITWPVVFDASGLGSPNAKKYGIDQFPRIFVLNKKGVILTSDATGFDVEDAVQVALRS